MMQNVPFKKEINQGTLVTKKVRVQNDKAAKKP